MTCTPSLTRHSTNRSATLRTCSWRVVSGVCSEAFSVVISTMFSWFTKSHTNECHVTNAVTFRTAMRTKTCEGPVSFVLRRMIRGLEERQQEVRRLEHLEAVDIQLVARQTVQRHPQQDVLRVHGPIELHIGGAAGIELELCHLLTLSGVRRGIDTHIALTARRADLDDQTVDIMRLTQMHIVAVALLPEPAKVVEILSDLRCRHIHDAGQLL